MKKNLIVDCFAGGGGASVGIEMALGRPVDIAINHDPDAILMHKTNHPNTLHLTEDIFNPQAAVEQMAQTNPNVKKAMDMCKGKNPKQVFEDMCRQNGMDPGQFSGLMK